MLKSTQNEHLKFKTQKDRIIWDNLVDLCVKSGIYKPVDVFRKTGISAQQLNDIPKGSKGFGAKSIRRICESFSVSEQWLLSPQGKESESMKDDLEYWKREANYWKREADYWKRQVGEPAPPRVAPAKKVEEN